MLSAGLRNGLENAIYDPLVLVYLIVRDLPLELPNLGLTNTMTTNHLAEMDAAEMQELANRLQNHVLGPRLIDCGDDVITYRGGRKLTVRRDWLQTDDHALAGKVDKALPNIHKIQSKNAGATPLYIVSRVLREKPDIIAQDLIDTLARLLDAPSHIPTR